MTVSRALAWLCEAERVQLLDQLKLMAVGIVEINAATAVQSIAKAELGQQHEYGGA
jgi:hypothetical protein